MIALNRLSQHCPRLVLLAALFMPLSLQAGSLAGVTLPDRASVDGKSLSLNGLGLRTATIFKVKVYVIGLYLEDKHSDAKAIIQSDGTKRIVMHFVHDVSASDLSGGWKEAFQANYENTDAIKDEIKAFKASMRDVKSGDTITLDFIADRVDVYVNDTRVDTVQGNAFQQAALSIWLGRKPPNPELKAGILGGN